MPKNNVDYSLYLVTDSTMLPEGKTLYNQIKDALKNGVTLVQLREKNLDSRNFVEEAFEVKLLCKEFNIPLIINDRVDVALAIDADGVHVGQDDIPIPLVRSLIGPDKILGWSVSKVSEVEQLAEWGPQMVDYIGIGMVFHTNTKKNPKKTPMGPRGVTEILDALEFQNANWCRTVAIGGLHPNNISRVLYQCVSSNGKRALDGISLVSDIMASTNAGSSTKILRDIINKRCFEFVDCGLHRSIQDCNELIPEIKSVIAQLSKLKPLVHHVTNRVHQNFGANVTLALGGSPIMSEIKEEVFELSQTPYATLLLNTGSVASTDVFKRAIESYNESKRPIILDPVGYSATQLRLETNDSLLNHGQFACIKGNHGEILSLARMNSQKMRGVDAGSQKASECLLVKATKDVAFRFRTVAVCTGEVDYVVDGTNHGYYELSRTHYSVDELRCYKVHAGPIGLMSRITASGCSLGSTISCLVGGLLPAQSLLSAVLGGVLLFKEAGKVAAARADAPGSFQTYLIDALYNLSQANEPENWTVNCSIVENTTDSH